MLSYDLGHFSIEGLNTLEAHNRLSFGSHETSPIIWIDKFKPCYLRVERWLVGPKHSRGGWGGRGKDDRKQKTLGPLLHPLSHANWLPPLIFLFLPCMYVQLTYTLACEGRGWLGPKSYDRTESLLLYILYSLYDYVHTCTCLQNFIWEILNVW